MVHHQRQVVLRVEVKIMNKRKKITIIIIISWVILGVLALIIFGSKKEKLLKDDKVDPIYTLNDKNDYNISIQAKIEENYSPLYFCQKDTVPKYLESLVSVIDPNLKKTVKSSLVMWQNDNNENIIVYNIDNTALQLYLDSYKTSIKFTTIESFLSEYLDSEIEYFDIKFQKMGEQDVYFANRAIEGKELLTGYGYSDFFVVEDGYLTSARILLAKINKEESLVPLLNDIGLLEKYISSTEFPKNIVINTSDIIQATPETYEDFDLDFEYDSCLINEIEPKLYFSSCNSNYIYYSYRVSGVCDVRYSGNLYSVSFQGFINAIDPKYVKSIE